MGAEVTVHEPTSPNKKADAEKLGAHKFVVTKDEEQLKSVQHYCLILYFEYARRRS